MKYTSILRVDSKGRITIPQIVREALDIYEGKQLLAVADFEKKEILITPITSKTQALYEIKVELKDVPGALASFGEKMKELKLDQLIVKCSSIKRGELAECVSIAEPLDPPSFNPDSVKKALEESGFVYFVSIKQLEPY